jgi:hypothetical protein
MSEQPNALRLANVLDNYIDPPSIAAAAAELRRLHDEVEGYKEGSEQSAIKGIEMRQRIYADYATMQQALQALEVSWKAMTDYMAAHYTMPVSLVDASDTAYEAIRVLEQALKEKL